MKTLHNKNGYKYILKRVDCTESEISDATIASGNPHTFNQMVKGHCFMAIFNTFQSK